MSTTRVRISIDIENIDAEDEIKQREDERLAQALKCGIECSASIEELASLCFQSVSTFKRKFRALQYLATSMAATTKVRDCTPHYRAEGDFYFRANNALWVQQYFALYPPIP